MPTAASTTFNARKLEPYLNPEAARMVAATFKASQVIRAGDILGQVTATKHYAVYADGNSDGTETARAIAVYDMIVDANGAIVFAPPQGTNEVQTVTIGGGATGGTFTLTFSGATTAAIAYGASAADVKAALEALPTIGDGDLTVTKASDVYTITFGGGLGGTNVAALTGSAAGLTGGTPTLTVATTTAGAAANPVADDQGIVRNDAPVYYKGTFRCEDLYGLDANGVADMNGRLVAGTVGQGIFTF